MQDRMEEDQNKIHGMDFGYIQGVLQRERELKKYQDQLQEQQKQLDEDRVRLKHEQLMREKEFEKERAAREKFFVERERKLIERQREYEELLTLQQQEGEEIKAKLINEVASRESELRKALDEFALEKERYNEENRKKIERTSKDYIATALETLDKKETQFHRISKLWSGIGAVSLAGGLVFFSYVTIATFFVIPNPVTWTFIIFALFKGLIALALIVALAKYAFLLSNSYMREALKNADRRHAINFGKFYLESFGAAADWAQIKEAFENWNIMGPNAFSEPVESQLDVGSLEKIAEVLERIGKSLSPLTKG